MIEFKNLVAATAGVALLIANSSAGATVVVDQSYFPAEVNSAASVNNWWGPVAQTFVPQVSGNLVGVDLLLVRNAASSTLFVQINEASTGAPTNSTLLSMTVDPAQLPNTYPSSSADFVHLNLPGEGPMLQAGTEYAIVMYRLTWDGSSIGWYGGTDNGYAAGAMFETDYDFTQHPGEVFQTLPSSFSGVTWREPFFGSPPVDLAFQTYMDLRAIPEPGTWLLALAGTTALGLAGRFRSVASLRSGGARSRDRCFAGRTRV